MNGIGRMGQSVIEMHDQSCGACGLPARVTVLLGYRESVPVENHYCLECADHAGNVDRKAGDRFWRGIQYSLVMVGMFCALAGLLADGTGAVIEAHLGFGLYQRIGAIAGALALLIGLVARVELVMLAGGAVLVLALSVDLLFVSMSPGIGWKQAILLYLSGALMAAAAGVHLWVHRRVRRGGGSW